MSPPVCGLALVKRPQTREGGLGGPEVGTVVRFLPRLRIEGNGAIDASAVLRTKHARSGEPTRQDQQRMARRRLRDLCEVLERSRFAIERVELAGWQAEARGGNQLDDEHGAPSERDERAIPGAEAVLTKCLRDRDGLVGSYEQVEIARVRRERPVDEDPAPKDGIHALQKLLVIDGSHIGRGWPGFRAASLPKRPVTLAERLTTMRT